MMSSIGSVISVPPPGIVVAGPWTRQRLAGSAWTYDRLDEGRLDRRPDPARTGGRQFDARQDRPAGRSRASGGTRRGARGRAGLLDQQGRDADAGYGGRRLASRMGLRRPPAVRCRTRPESRSPGGRHPARRELSRAGGGPRRMDRRAARWRLLCSGGGAPNGRLGSVAHAPDGTVDPRSPSVGDRGLGRGRPVCHPAGPPRWCGGHGDGQQPIRAGKGTSPARCR